MELDTAPEALAIRGGAVFGRLTPQGSKQGESSQMSNQATKIDLYGLTQINAPDDVVVNIGKSPILVGGSEHVTKDSARIDSGDRRQGAYYLDILAKTPDAVRGLVQLNKCPQEVLDRVDREREVRVGVRAPKWVEKARKQAEKDGDVPVFDSQKAAMVGIQKRRINEEVEARQRTAAANSTVKDFTSGYADED